MCCPSERGRNTFAIQKRWRMRGVEGGLKRDQRAPGWATGYFQLPNRNHLRNKLFRREGSGSESETWVPHRLKRKAQLDWESGGLPTTLPAGGCCNAWMRAYDPIFGRQPGDDRGTGRG